MIQITADTVAIAVVAAAQRYGDHPLRAFEAKRGLPRRSLASAAIALVELELIDEVGACRLLGTSVETLRSRRREGPGPGSDATKAARRALMRAGVASPTSAPTSPAPAAPPPASPSPPLRVSVAGIERDKAALGRVAQGGCHAHKHLGAVETPCPAPAVRGRLFCADHCLAMGQKATPVDLGTPLMPRPYSPRALG